MRWFVVALVVASLAGCARPSAQEPAPASAPATTAATAATAAASSSPSSSAADGASPSRRPLPPPTSARVDPADVREVVLAVAAFARENAAKPASERLAGDALADRGVRAAFATGRPARAVLLGLAHAVDDAGMLAKNPLLVHLFRGVETKEERASRLAAIGRPTLRGRADWLSHFFVSAALAGMFGGESAEAIAIQKELTDACRMETGGGSGFSFADLGADFAGIELASVLLDERAPEISKAAIESCATSFEGVRFLPDVRGWPEGLPEKEFEATWGGVKGPRFVAECARLRAVILECDGFRELRAR